MDTALHLTVAASRLAAIGLAYPLVRTRTRRLLTLVGTTCIAVNQRGHANGKIRSVTAASCGNPPRSLSFLAMLALLLLPTCTLAQEFAAMATAEQYSGLGYSVDTTRGWQFTVSAEIRVVKLGFWDSYPSGLSAAHPIGIWQDEGQVLLTSATVESSQGAPLDGFFRWVAVEPVVLKPGKTYVIGAYWQKSSGDTCLAGGGASTVFDKRVTITGARGNSFTGLAFPWSTTVPLELTPNFRAVPVPAPVNITAASLTGTVFTIRFTSAAGLTGWKVAGCGNLGVFSEDKTAESVITEESPGIYQAVVELGGLADKYFLRIER